jgi:hypothetical protein
MQCNKAIYPHSKYNYVSCTRLVENFSEGTTGTPDPSKTTDNTTTTNTGTDSNSGTTSNGTSTGTSTGTSNGTSSGNSLNCSLSGDTSSGNFSLTCSRPKTAEGFADVLPLATTAQEAMATAGQGIAGAAQGVAGAAQGAAQGLANAVVPMAAKAAAVTGVSDLINQVKQDKECNKTTLHITIGVLVTVLIGLVAYIVYQQMKNKQQ